MNEDKKLKPFGEIAESFKELKDEGIYYVDKTAIIPYLVTQKRKICVVTRPRRFGKTLMLRMLQTFFEYALDKDGNPVDNRRYFEGLKVMDAGEDVLKEMGQYPVISLSFKEVSGNTYEEVIEQLRGAVCEACAPHEKILKDSGILSNGQLEILQSYLDGEAACGNVRLFLKYLPLWLFKVTHKKVVILLDEYDVPLQKAAIYDLHHPGSNLFDDIVSLIGKFISAGFKSNSNLAYGIIAGCMRVAKESIFTGMNNPGVLTVVDEIPDEFWGFTEADVKQMLSYYDIEDKYEMLEKWYDGYEYSGRKVFNPVSLLNAIRGLVNGYGDDAIQSYWAMTSSNDIIDEMIDNNPQHREALASLMNGETMTVPVIDNLSYRDLKQNPDAIWSFLLYTGYLKAIKVGKDDDNLQIAEVAVPNNEILTVMKSAMQHWWKDIYLDGCDARPLMHALWNGDVASIEREIRTILNNSVSTNDAKEDFYHGMLVGVLSTIKTVKSNRESGEGRPDIVVKDGNRAIILEIKCLLPSAINKMPLEQQFVKVPAMMNALLDEAETQFRTRYYIQGLKFEDENITEVKGYAVCFCKKRCAVRRVNAE